IPDRRRRATARGRRRWSCSRAEASIRRDARRLEASAARAPGEVWAIVMIVVVVMVRGSRFGVRGLVRGFVVQGCGSAFNVRSIDSPNREPRTVNQTSNREPRTANPSDNLLESQYV